MAGPMAAHHIALAKIPQSTWTKRFLATACVLTGRIDKGGHIFAQIHDSPPAFDHADPRAGLP